MAPKCQKLALLVGCNYPNNGKNDLHGCINDVMVTHEALVTRFGFNRNCVEIMIDDHPGSKKLPTGANIKKSLNRMVDQAKPGDVMFFFFSGHGTKFRSNKIPNKDVEAIVPCDSNLITCVDFRVLVDRVPKGATFTFCSDSCSSGGLIDKEKEQIGPTHRALDEDQSNTAITTVLISSDSLKPKFIPYESMLQQVTSLTNLNSPDMEVHLLHMFGCDASLMFRIPSHHFPWPLKPDQGILLSGCQSNENSLDVEIEGKFCGLFTYALHKALKQHPAPLSNKQLVLKTRYLLFNRFKHLARKQHPCLYCSDRNVHAVFLHQPR